MLKAIVGSIIGGIVAGAVALVATASSRTSTPASPWAAVSTQPVGIVDAIGSRAATNEPALIECEPNQRAELRRVSMNGREVAQVACTSVVQPAAYAASDIVTAPAVVQRAPATQTIVRERVVTREPVRRQDKRSWAKTALVIGGSSGAGAGVGGLVGGKKGALIGAAIGGGSAAIFEAIKR